MSDAVLLLLPGRPLDLAIDAAAVVRVLLARDWRDVPPLDLRRAFDWSPEEEEAREDDRVLLVRSRLGEVPLRGGARARLREGLARILPLPDAVLGGACALALAGVVIEEGRRPALVLQPEGLFHLYELAA